MLLNCPQAAPKEKGGESSDSSAMVLWLRIPGAIQLCCFLPPSFPYLVKYQNWKNPHLIPQTPCKQLGTMARNPLLMWSMSVMLTLCPKQKI